MVVNNCPKMSVPLDKLVAMWKTRSGTVNWKRAQTVAEMLP
jgi:hypothetical protein